MRRIVLCAMLVLLALTSDAFARHHDRRIIMSVQPSDMITVIGPSIYAAHEAQLIAIAKSQIGAGAIYGRQSLWCARFMNWTLKRAGYRGTGSDLAKSFLKLPHTHARVGAIAVFARGKHGGHVGLVTGFDARGNPIIVSGNHGHRVAKAVYPRGRVLAYVSPA